MNRCPSCLSTVETLEGRCPHCDNQLRAPAKGGKSFALGILAGVLATAVVAWLATRGEQASGLRSEAAEPPPTAAPTAMPAIAAREVAPAPEAPPCIWPLESERGQWPGLALAHPGGALVFLPLAALEGEGGFRDSRSGQRTDLGVVTYDAMRGFLLLRPRGALPADLRPVEIGQLGRTWPRDDLRALRPDGAEKAITGLRQNASGRLELDRDVPPGSAILDRDGRALAYAAGRAQALPLEPVVPWLAYQGERDLDEVRAEIRSRDPRLLLADAIEIMNESPRDLVVVRRGIEMIERGAAIARERDLAERYLEEQPRAYQLLVRALLPRDTAAAIARLRSALISFPDHLGLLSDAVEIFGAHGDPLEAAGIYARLLARSPDHAQQVADSLARDLVAGARRLRVQGRPGDALALGERAVYLFPGRADLRMALANALLEAGQLAWAFAEAREAAFLDPAAHQGGLARFEAALSDAGHPSRVSIPFDPATNVVRAEVSVAGEAMSFVVDTGASLTTIPSAVAGRLGLLSPENRRIDVHTASGTVQGEVVRVPWMQIGPLRLRRVEAVVLDLPNQLGDKGLLGMNALRRMRVQIDSERGVLVLEQRRRR